MLVLWFDETPGGWSYFKEMALHLAEAGLKLSILSPRAKNNKRVEKLGNNITVYRCTSIYFPQIPFLMVNPYDFLQTLKRIFREDSPFNLIYDVTSGLLPFSPIIKLFFKLRGIRLPLVVNVLGELKEMKSKGFLSLLFELYLHIVARLCFTVADKVLIAGRKIAPRALSLGAEVDKLEIVKVGLKYEGRDSHVLSKEKKAKLKGSIGLDEDDFVVGYVGRLAVGKGLEILLKAVAAVNKTLSKPKVLLVGDGGERKQLNVLANEFGIGDITYFLGYREDVLDLMQLMDVFVNLSKSEAGISATQIEAMQSSLPSIITPFTDFMEDMKDAIIVPFEDAQAVADAILLLFKNSELRKLIGRNASAKAQELLNSYTWNGYVSRVMKVFEAFTRL